MNVGETFLIGKEAICEFVGRSWKTVREWIDKRGFPARKINGVWESEPGLIVEWRRREILGRISNEEQGNQIGVRSGGC